MAHNGHGEHPEDACDLPAVGFYDHSPLYWLCQRCRNVYRVYDGATNWHWQFSDADAELAHWRDRHV